MWGKPNKVCCENAPKHHLMDEAAGYKGCCRRQLPHALAWLRQGAPTLACTALVDALG